MPTSKKYLSILLGDGACVFFSFGWVTLLRRWQDFTDNPHLVFHHFLLFLVLTILWLWVFYLCGLYEPRNLGRYQEELLVVGQGTAFLLSALCLYFISGVFEIPTPKTILFLASFLSGAMIHFWRSSINKTPHPAGGPGAPPSDQAVIIEQKLLANPETDGYHETLKKAALEGKPVFSSSTYEALYLGKVPVDGITAAWLLDRILSATTAKAFYAVLKRLLDFSLTLLFFAPAALAATAVACWIKIFLGGPVFYRQERMGKGNRAFTIWKFRTMRNDSRKTPSVTQPEDLRIPGPMRWVRRTHLDELPQLINVLRGEMSLVGPRPEQVPIANNLESQIPYFWVRHTASPGLTGWAQINMGYASTAEDAKERFGYDLYYLANRSFWLDVSILVRTLRNILFAKGR
ncbi:MAG: sugar transferase [Elusimicrobia bacterium]|nr:sugar transferase [Elusimicrobiota bacterium]